MNRNEKEETPLGKELERAGFDPDGVRQPDSPKVQNSGLPRHGHVDRMDHCRGCSGRNEHNQRLDRTPNRSTYGSRWHNRFYSLPKNSEGDKTSRKTTMKVRCQ